MREKSTNINSSNPTKIVRIQMCIVAIRQYNCLYGFSSEYKGENGRIFGGVLRLRSLQFIFQGAWQLGSFLSTWWGPQPKKKSRRMKLPSAQRYWSPWSLISLFPSSGSSKCSHCWDIFFKEIQSVNVQITNQMSCEYISLGGKVWIKNSK